MSEIFKNFPVTTDEFDVLNEKYGRLCHKISWDLIKRNGKNNHTDEQEDINQEILISLMQAVSYYKRQTYIQKCLELCQKYARGRKFLFIMVRELQSLWKNKKRHGAGKQKFGVYQEELLEKLVRFLVPKRERPAKNAPLEINSDFGPYCKSIAWNRQRSLGKKISREKPLRMGLTSISEYPYLGGK
jgi:hypothetical protein